MDSHKAKTALITGASSGIGAAFARELAAQHYQLILVARRKPRLEALAAQLQADFGSTPEILVADLTSCSGIEQVENRIKEAGGLALLINNAGFGTWDRFSESKLSKQLEMVELHIVAPMRLCHAALSDMLACNSGAIINVASIGAFVSARRNVTYNATKAFLVSFSQSLHSELKGTRVSVQALCPGFTYSEFHDSLEYASFSRSQIPGWLWSPAEKVVSASLKTLEKNQPVFIPGFKNRVVMSLIRSRLVRPLFKLTTSSIQKRANLN